MKVFKCIFNDTVTLQQTFYYLNIYSILLICTTDDEVCRLRNMFLKIKYIVFKIKILTVLLLSRSFGNCYYVCGTRLYYLLVILCQVFWHYEAMIS